MFSNSSDTIEVTITMVDGKTMTGRLSMGTSSTIQGVLAYNAPFLEIVTKDGQKRFVSKQAIAILEPVEKLKTPVLDPRTGQNCDPYQVLKVAKGSDFQVVRHTYLELAKQYHPDTYAKVELPREVAQYIGDMFRQINAAFVEIKQDMKPNTEAEAA